MIDQYTNYSLPELDNLPLNGITTQAENIADNGGIKVAYRAYSELQYWGSVGQLDCCSCLDEWVNTHGEEQRLPGLDFTPRQMFWISAANVWCSKSRPQALKHSVLTGTHSPDQFRVQVEIFILNRERQRQREITLYCTYIFRERFRTWKHSPKILNVHLDQKWILKTI